MPRSTSAIQVLIIASAILGVALLWEIRSMVPANVLEIVTVGWILFVVDSALTFLKPTPSYYFGLVLAVLALSSSLPQSAHWAFIENGVLVPSAIFIAGSAMQVLIIVLVVLFAVSSRRQRMSRQG